MKRVYLLLVAVLIFWPVQFGFSAIPSTQSFEYSGDGEIKFYNTHSKEVLKIDFRDRDRNYLEKGIEEVNYVLRCRLTGEEIKMDLKLIELIDHLQDHFGVDEVEIISGYRSPQLNSALRKAGRGVASRSFHMRGMAADIRLPGVPLKALKEYAASLKVGGVGFYPGPNFVHVDTGPVRYW